jgi:hypothetical protein
VAPLVEYIDISDISYYIIITDIEALSVDSSEESVCTDGHCCGVDNVPPVSSDANLLRDLQAAKDRALVAEEQLKLVLADLEKMRYSGIIKFYLNRNCHN